MSFKKVTFTPLDPVQDPNGTNKPGDPADTEASYQVLPCKDDENSYLAISKNSLPSAEPTVKVSHETKTYMLYDSKGVPIVACPVTIDGGDVSFNCNIQPETTNAAKNDPCIREADNVAVGFRLVAKNERGPWDVSKFYLGDRDQLNLTAWVNGCLAQHVLVADLRASCGKLRQGTHPLVFVRDSSDKMGCSSEWNSRYLRGSVKFSDPEHTPPPAPYPTNKPVSNTKLDIGYATFALIVTCVLNMCYFLFRSGPFGSVLSYLPAFSVLVVCALAIAGLVLDLTVQDRKENKKDVVGILYVTASILGVLLMPFMVHQAHPDHRPSGTPLVFLAVLFLSPLVCAITRLSI